MFQPLPDNTYELLIGNTETIVYVLNLSGLRDFLSGDTGAKPFCIITTEHVYFYSLDKNGNVCADICDHDDITSLDYSTVRQPVKLYNLLFSLAAFLLSVLSAYLSYKTFGALFSALLTVFLAFDAFLLFIASIALFIRAIHIYNTERHAVANIKYRDSVFAVELSSSATNDIRTFKTELIRARAARRAANPETFLY